MNLEWLLEKQLNWIAQADNKLAVLGPLPLAMLAISLSGASVNLEKIELLDFPIAASTALLCLSLFFSKAALTPRLNGPIESLIFFGRISEFSSEEFVKKIEDCDEGTFQKDILLQIHRNARIAEQKHKNIGLSVFWLAVATPLWLLAVALEF